MPTLIACKLSEKFLKSLWLLKADNSSLLADIANPRTATAVNLMNKHARTYNSDTNNFLWFWGLPTWKTTASNDMPTIPESAGNLRYQTSGSPPTHTHPRYGTSGSLHNLHQGEDNNCRNYAPCRHRVYEGWPRPSQDDKWGASLMGKYVVWKMNGRTQLQQTFLITLVLLLVHWIITIK